jgi:hypothetical protein
MTSHDAVTFVASVLGSGLIAAWIAARAQRKQQLRERMLSVASDFAATTMKVLASLRHYKPTKPGAHHHRNEPLIADRHLRAERYENLQENFDELRALRGRVRLHFPEAGRQRSEVTMRADEVVGALRDASDASEHFWQRCDEGPRKRRKLEERFEAEYQAARSKAWDELNDFCNLAATSALRREGGPSLFVRLRYRLNHHAVAPTGSGADSRSSDGQGR